MTVLDENGIPIRQALVVGQWTEPNGTVRDQVAWTGSTGVAVFDTTGRLGTYSLTVVNIVQSQYTFDPDRSLLFKSITVTSW